MYFNNIPQSASGGYQINHPFIEPEEYQQPQGVNEPLPFGPMFDPNHPLAQREGLTRDYINSYGALRDFTHAMFKKGINPFRPDYAQDGGGEPYIQAKKMEATVMKIANALKNEYEAEKRIQPLELAGKVNRKQGVDTNGLYYSNPDNFYSTEPTEGVQAANKLAEKDTYTQQDESRRNKTIEQEIAAIDQDVQKGIYSRERGDLLKSYIVRNSHITPLGLLSTYARGSASNNNMMTLFQKVSNITRGVFPEGHKETIHGGKHFVESNSLVGDNFGETQVRRKDGTVSTAPKIIKRVLKDSNGKVYFQYENGDIPNENVSDISPDEVFRRIVESNSGKYGKTGALPDLYNQLEHEGWLAENRSVPKDIMFGKGAHEEYKKSFPNHSVSQAIADKTVEVGSKLKKLKTGVIFDDSDIFETPSGPLKIKAAGDGTYKITNIKDYDPQGSSSTKYTEAEIISKLTDAGYFDDMLSGAKQEKSSYNINGKSYSHDDLLKLGYTEEQIQSAIKAGKIK